nr:uncharacterized protein LOC127295066 isoform X3 [Lolium perenne]XP_051180934.1 uncharacterized protein LOC127295066 isoform X4 [Lolium perenne]XP_051180935.1 uncharacterized protein LOC127295066 isoform X5 [Lolium perenne]
MSPWRRRGRPPLAKLKPPEDAPCHSLHPHARNRAKTPLIELKIADTQLRQPVHPRRHLSRPGSPPSDEAMVDQGLRHGRVCPSFASACFFFVPRLPPINIASSSLVIPRRETLLLTRSLPSIDISNRSPDDLASHGPVQSPSRLSPSRTRAQPRSAAASASICFFPDRNAKWCCEIRQVLRMSLGKL